MRDRGRDRGGFDAVDVVRIAARLQRVLRVAERATVATVTAVGSAWVAARVIASHLRRRLDRARPR